MSSKLLTLITGILIFSSPILSFTSAPNVKKILAAGELEFSYGISDDNLHIRITRLKAGWAGIGFGKNVMLSLI